MAGTLTTPRPTESKATAIERWGGYAGIAFALSVIVQNLLRSSFAPSGDASAADIRSYVVDDRWVIQTTVPLVAINVVFLLLFVATLYRRTQDGPGAVWARVGLVGATGVLALFLTAVAVEMTLAAQGSSLSPELTETLWALHNAVFACAFLGVGTALLGFSLASVPVGLLPRAYRIVGPVAAALMIITAGAGVAVTEGSSVLFVGLVGFLGWLVFLFISGTRLARGQV